MKVGVVTTSYPRFPDDPAGNFVGEHVRALRALGHEVEVIAAADSERDATAGLERASDAGVVRVPQTGLFYGGGAPDLLERAPRRFVDAALFSSRLALAIARRARRWDSVVAHWLVPGAIACAVAAPRTPLLAIAHGGDVHTLRRLRLLAPVLQLLHARDARIVFVSEELRALALASIARAPFATPALARWIAEASVQPMGIDSARFAAIARAEPSAPATPSTIPTIVIASRLVPVKGIDVAIAAMASVRHRARLVIAGSGPDHDRLVHAALASAPVIDLAPPRDGTIPHAAARRGPWPTASDPMYGWLASIIDASDPRLHAPITTLQTRADVDVPEPIAFVGELSTRARDRLLAEAALVVVPSRHVGRRSEGTPLIALEALAAGIPVIASAVGGLRTLRGVELVPPDDPLALARAIDRVLAAPPDGATLRASVAHLDWRHIAGTLVRSP